MSERQKLALEIVGAITLIAGLALVSVPLALIVAGILLIAAGNVPERRS